MSGRELQVGRRSALFALATSPWIFAGCTRSDAPRNDWVPRGPEHPSADPPVEVTSDLDALFDVILPTERDASGRVVTPGARETGAADVLRLRDFVPLAAARGWIPPVDEALSRALDDVDGAFVGLITADLAARALAQAPLTAFRDLPRLAQEEVVADAFDDPRSRPVMLVVRAACFAAWLGAITGDAGLRAVGFPPFEDFASRLAVSGYPRTKSGRLVDVSKEDLAALLAAGELDDYTYGVAPEPTPGESLSALLDARGDLL